MSHFMLSQGKFVFAIFACDHELLASDDASCAYQKHGGRSRQLASWHQLATDSDLLRIDFGRKMLNVIKINKVAAILYVKYLVGGGNELFVVKFIDECV